MAVQVSNIVFVSSTAIEYNLLNFRLRLSWYWQFLHIQKYYNLGENRKESLTFKIFLCVAISSQLRLRQKIDYELSTNLSQLWIFSPIF